MGFTKETRIDFALKRFAPRFASAHPIAVVFLRQGEPFAGGTVRNISRGGLCVSSMVEAIGVKGLRVRILVDESRVMEVGGRVVWTEPAYPADSAGDWIHGIELDPFEDADLEVLIKKSR